MWTWTRDFYFLFYMNVDLESFVLRTSAFMGVYEDLLFFHVRFHEYGPETFILCTSAHMGVSEALLF